MAATPMRYFRYHHGLFVLLIFTTNLYGMESSTLQGETSSRGLDEEDLLPHFLYKPYSHKNNRMYFGTGRIGNQNANEVKSCASCCLDDPVSPENSVFVGTMYEWTLSLDGFYGKVVSVNGVPVAASSAVSDAAVLETALTIIKMASKNPSLLDMLRDELVHFAVIGKDEVLSDNPHYNFLGSEYDWTRGVGATAWVPVSSCAEENLLCLQNDVYWNENICVHETAHTLQGSGSKLMTTRIINGQDLDSLLREVYDEDVVNGNLWENTYAGTNHEEMWAEAVQSYYSVNTEGPVGGDGVSNHIWSHDLLADYDPKLYKIIEDVFPSDVDFSCPTTSLDDCDCTRIRQLCTQAGVPLPSTSANPPINLPTDGPTTFASSTASTDCVDDENFRVNGIEEYDCAWVGKMKTNKRCQLGSEIKAYDACPATCNPYCIPKQPTPRPTTMPGVSSSFKQETNAGKWFLLSISVIVHFLY